jgi:hypothetical protein
MKNLLTRKIKICVVFFIEENRTKEKEKALSWFFSPARCVMVVVFLLLSTIERFFFGSCRQSR